MLHVATEDGSDLNVSKFDEVRQMELNNAPLNATISFADGSSRAAKHYGTYRYGRRQGGGAEKSTSANCSYQFSGSYIDDKKCGHGHEEVTLADTKAYEEYDGDFIDGQRSGRGELKEGNAIEGTERIYTGDFKGGQKHGRGEEKFVNAEGW
jgi:hypothetical protein